MDKIASFQIDHTNLDIGMYLSRTDGDITTYDLRMTRPGKNEPMQNAAMHTIEHLFATFARNSKFGKNIIYVGPMGCRTGFYLLTRDLPHRDAVTLVRDSFAFIHDYNGDIPGASPIECGNWQEHDLAGAKATVKPLLLKINDIDGVSLKY